MITNAAELVLNRNDVVVMIIAAPSLTLIGNILVPTRHKFSFVFLPRNSVIKGFPTLSNSGDKGREPSTR